jgi:hypothetical protein
MPVVGCCEHDTVPSGSMKLRCRALDETGLKYCQMAGFRVSRFGLSDDSTSQLVWTYQTKRCHNPECHSLNHEHQRFLLAHRLSSKCERPLVCITILTCAAGTLWKAYWIRSSCQPIKRKNSKNADWIFAFVTGVFHETCRHFPISVKMWRK